VGCILAGGANPAHAALAALAHLPHIAHVATSVANVDRGIALSVRNSVGSIDQIVFHLGIRGIIGIHG